MLSCMYSTCANLDRYELDNDWYIVDELWPPYIQLRTLVTMVTTHSLEVAVCAERAVCMGAQPTDRARLK
jgi:hypothetical protein